MVERIRELCRKKGISILKLEMACGFSNGSINKWSRQSPSADKLSAVASYFGVSMEYLLTGERPAQMDEPSPGELAVINRLRQMPNAAQAQAAVLAFLQALEHQTSESDE